MHPLAGVAVEDSGERIEARAILLAERDELLLGEYKAEPVLVRPVDKEVAAERERDFSRLIKAVVRLGRLVRYRFAADTEGVSDATRTRVV